jgi:hypothetical protein
MDELRASVRNRNRCSLQRGWGRLTHARRDAGEQRGGGGWAPSAEADGRGPVRTGDLSGVSRVLEPAELRARAEVKLQRNATTHDERFATERGACDGLMERDDIG